MKKLSLILGLSILAFSLFPGFSTKAQSCNPDALVPVKYGQRGDAVRNAQLCLMEAGYDIPAGATGYYGPQTKAAVRAFYADWYGYRDGNNLGPRGVQELRNMLAGAPSKEESSKEESSKEEVSQSSQQDQTAAIVAAVLAALQQMGILPSTTTPATTSATTSEEAIVEVRLSPTPGSGVVVKEGQSGDVLGVKVISRRASANVQRVRFDLISSKLPTRIFSSFELYDGSTRVASVSAGDYVRTQSTVYQYTFVGFNVDVPANSEKVLTIRAVVNPVVDSSDIGSFTVVVKDGYVRAVDNSGVQHTPNVTGSVARTFSVEKAVPASVAVTVYRDQNSPRSNNFAADLNRDIKNVELLRFVVRADNDTLKIQKVKGTLATSSRGVESVSAIRLLDASGNEVAAVANPTSSVSFEAFDFNTPLATVNKDQTAVFRVVADVRVDSTLTTTTAATVQFTVTSVEAEDSIGNSVSATSLSVDGDTMYLYRVAAPRWEVTSAQAATSKAQGQATTTLTATFVVNLTALGGDVYIPSSNPFVATTTGATSTSMGSPSVTYGSGVELVSGYGYVVRKGTTGTFTVNFALTPADWGISGGYVAVILQSMTWTPDTTLSPTTTNFPGNLETKTRTPDVYLAP